MGGWFGFLPKNSKEFNMFDNMFRVGLLLVTLCFAVSVCADTTPFNCDNCNLKFNIDDLNKNEKCESDLKAIVYKDFELKNINKKDVGFDFSEQNFIKIFVKSDSGVNDGVTIGWIKIDKNKNQLYNITYDDENKVPMNVLGINDYINKCL